MRTHVEKVFRSPDDSRCGSRAATGASGRGSFGARSTPCTWTSCRPPRETGSSTRCSKTWKPGRSCSKAPCGTCRSHGDASPTSAGENLITPHNRYQNGAFWHTPVGWLIAVLDREHPRQAAAAFQDITLGTCEKAISVKASPMVRPGSASAGAAKADQNPAFVPSVCSTVRRAVPSSLTPWQRR